MPSYKFLNIDSGEIEEHSIRIAEYDQFKESNPQLKRYFDSEDTPSTISGAGGIKTDSGFKEVLSKVAEAHPNSALAQKTITRSSTQVKTDNVKKKHGLMT